MSVIGSNALAGASGQGGDGFVIEKSLRFNDGDSAYLNRTPSSTGSTTTWTFSGWIKRAKGESGYPGLLSVGANSQVNGFLQISFEIDEFSVYMRHSGGTNYAYTNAKLRDNSAWYHLVVALDTTAAAEADRLKMYVNGVQQTFRNSLIPAQNQTFLVNDTVLHQIGATKNSAGTTGPFYAGYMTDVHLVDGQALAPTDFGEFDDNGVWQPKKFTGSHNFTPTVTYPAVYVTSPGAYGAVTDVNTVNGNVFTSAGSAGAGSIKVVFESAVTGVTHVKFKGGGYSANAGFSIKVNGSTTHSSLTTNSSYTVRTETLSSATDITSFEIVSSGDGWALGDLQFSTDGTNFTAPSGTAAVIPTAGVNGFHLDFADSSDLGNDAAGSNNWTANNLTGALSTISSPNRTTWNSISNWTRSNSNYDADYSGSGYTGIQATLSASTTYHFYLTFKDTSGSYGGWYFTDSSSAPSNTVPNELGSNSFGLRTGQTSAGTHGSYATANGTSDGANQYTLTALQSSGTTEHTVEFVINTTAGKVWARKVGDSSWVGNGDPSNSSSTPSFEIPTGAQYFGYMGYQTGSYADFATQAGDPADIDLLVDSPTNGNTDDDTGAGGVLSGNYCTWNPLSIRNGNGTMQLLDGNLNFGDQGSSHRYGSVIGTIAVNSGKWFVECTYGSGGGLDTNVIFGLVPVEKDANYNASSRQSITGMIALRGPHAHKQGATESSDYASGLAIGDTVSVAFDCDNGTSTWYKNGTSLGTFPHTFSTKYSWTPCAVDWSNGTPGSSYILNCGQRPFSMTPPTGYKALCTANLPTPNVPDGSTYHDVKTWNGNGSTQSITGYEFSPDLVWIKKRSGTSDQALFDTIRGATKRLYTNDTSGQDTLTNTLTAFNSDGFSLGDANDVNQSSETYVGWGWDAGDSNTSISAGSLNSSVYDQSQRWRDYLTSTQSFATNYGKEKAFNGVFDGTGGLVTIGVVTFTPPAMTVTSLEVNVYSSLTITLPDGTNVSVSGSSTNDVYRTVNIGSGFSFTGSNSITFTPPSGSYVYIDRIKINGKELVDDDVTVTNVPTIASTYRANPSAGFSIVSWTGTGAAGTLAHGLGKKPELIITKVYSSSYSDNWPVYHPVYGAGTYLYFNSNIAAPASYTGFFNNVEPDSNVFSVGTANSDNTKGLIAYCFTSVAGYSKIDSYMGNGSSDGPFVYTGFRPRFILIKDTDTAAYMWNIYDSARDTSNVSNTPLEPNTSASETGTTYPGAVDFLSNGFRIRSPHSSSYINTSGNTVIYAAFAENPFQANGGLAR